MFIGHKSIWAFCKKNSSSTLKNVGLRLLCCISFRIFCNQLSRQNSSSKILKKFGGKFVTSLMLNQLVTQQASKFSHKFSTTTVFLWRSKMLESPPDVLCRQKTTYYSKKQCMSISLGLLFLLLCSGIPEPKGQIFQEDDLL